MLKLPVGPKGHSAWDYAESIIYYLAGILTALQNAQGNDPISRRIPFNIQCDASGNGTQEVRLPRGAIWTLQGIGFTASTSGYVATYINEIAGTSLIKVNPSALLVTDEYSRTQISKDDPLLIIAVVGQTANQIVSGNLRVLQYEAADTEPVRAR